MLGTDAAAHGLHQVVHSTPAGGFWSEELILGHAGFRHHIEVNVAVTHMAERNQTRTRMQVSDQLTATLQELGDA